MAKRKIVRVRKKIVSRYVVEATVDRDNKRKEFYRKKGEGLTKFQATNLVRRMKKSNVMHGDLPLNQRKEFTFRNIKVVRVRKRR